MEIAELYKLFLEYPSVQTDTRKLQPGDIYFALSGNNFNGNTFASEAIKKGAAYCIIDQPEYRINDKCIVVDDVLKTLQQLAHYHRKQFHIPIIAITGSNGKTTTKELITAVLSKKYNTYNTAGNLNNHIGVPLTLLKIKGDAEIAIIEMGANHQGEIAGYCQVASPNYGLITNCGKAHLEGFGGIEGVRKGKGELYDYIRKTEGTIFRNTELDYLESMARGINKQVTYGTDFGIYKAKPVMNGACISLSFYHDGKEELINTQLVGEYNFPNILVALAVGLYFSVPFQLVKQAIEEYSPDNSRSQLMLKGTNQIILDAYNANPTSMKAAILNFAYNPMPEKKLWIGAMKEMGKEEVFEHEQLVKLIEEFKWKEVILVGKEFKDLHKDFLWFENSIAAGEYVRTHLPENSSILIKGSRGSKMEEMLKQLPG